MRNRPGFAKSQLTNADARAKESFDIATKIYNEVRLRLVSLVLKKTTTLIERVLPVNGKISAAYGEKNQSHRQQGFILDCARSTLEGLIVEAIPNTFVTRFPHNHYSAAVHTSCVQTE
jgi:hypothetical protein